MDSDLGQWLFEQHSISSKLFDAFGWKYGYSVKTSPKYMSLNLKHQCRSDIKSDRVLVHRYLNTAQILCIVIRFTVNLLEKSQPSGKLLHTGGIAIDEEARTWRKAVWLDVHVTFMYLYLTALVWLSPHTFTFASVFSPFIQHHTLFLFTMDANFFLDSPAVTPTRSSPSSGWVASSQQSSRSQCRLNSLSPRSVCRSGSQHSGSPGYSNQQSPSVTALQRRQARQIVTIDIKQYVDSTAREFRLNEELKTSLKKFAKVGGLSLSFHSLTCFCSSVQLSESFGLQRD